MRKTSLDSQAIRAVFSAHERGFPADFGGCIADAEWRGGGRSDQTTRLGAYAARFQGGSIVCAAARRLLLRACAGGGAGRTGDYATDVQNPTTGCSLIAEGEVVASEGKGQSVELLATRIETVGMVDDPETYPMPAKRHTFEYLRDRRICARTNAIFRDGSSAALRGECNSSVLSRERILLGAHPIVTAAIAKGRARCFA